MPLALVCVPEDEQAIVARSMEGRDWNMVTCSPPDFLAELKERKPLLSIIAAPDDPKEAKAYIVKAAEIAKKVGCVTLVTLPQKYKTNLERVSKWGASFYVCKPYVRSKIEFYLDWAARSASQILSLETRESHKGEQLLALYPKFTKAEKPRKIDEILADVNNSRSLSLTPAATSVAIAEVEAILGYHLPADLRDFYRKSNGIEFQGGESDYLILPVESLAPVSEDLLPDSWVGLTDAGDGNFMAIDLKQGCVIDCFHELIGVEDAEFSVVSRSFNAYLDQLIKKNGEEFWLAEGFVALGSARIRRK